MELAGLKVVMEADFTQVYSDLAQVNTMLQGFAQNVKNVFNGIPDLGKRFSFTSNGASQAAQDAREYARAQRESAAADLDATKAKILLEREQERQSRNNARNLGEYAALKAEVNTSVRAYYDAAASVIKYGDAAGISAAKLDELRRAAAEGEQQLQRIEQGAGRFQRQVGNYAVGTAALAQQLRQITTEIPNFFISARIGFQSLSNNLPGIFSELTRIREANQALAASGQPTVSVFKQFLGAFNPLNIAIGVGVGLLTAYGPELLEVVKGLFAGSEAAKAAAQAQREYDEATKKSLETATKAAHEERVNADLLYAATQNVSLSYHEREIAAKKLIEIAPTLFKGLNEEAIIAGRAAGAYNKLTEAIKQKIAVAVGEEQATQLFKEAERTKQLVNDQRELVGVTEKLNVARIKQYNLAVQTQGVMTKERRDLATEIASLYKRQKELSGNPTFYINDKAFAPNLKKQQEALDGYTQALGKYEKKIQDVSLIRGQIDAIFDKPGKEKVSGAAASASDALGDLLKENQIVDNMLKVGAISFADSLKEKINNYESYIKKLATSKINVGVNDPRVQSAIASLEQLNNELSKLSDFSRLDTAFDKGKGFKALTVEIAKIGPAATLSFGQFQKALADAKIGERIRGEIEATEELMKALKEMIKETLLESVNLLSEGIGNLVAGTGGVSDLFKNIGVMLGDQIVSLGKMLIKAGLTMTAVWKAIEALGASGPFGAALSVAAGLAAIAAGTAIKAALSKSASGVGRQAFASGGIVYGPTNALVGEYSGARGNPEVIAPLDKLTSILRRQNIGRGGNFGAVIAETRVDGQDLLLILKRAEKSFRR